MSNLLSTVFVGVAPKTRGLHMLKTAAQHFPAEFLPVSPVDIESPLTADSGDLYLSATKEGGFPTVEMCWCNPSCEGK